MNASQRSVWEIAVAEEACRPLHHTTADGMELRARVEVDWDLKERYAEARYFDGARWVGPRLRFRYWAKVVFSGLASGECEIDVYASSPERIRAHFAGYCNSKVAW